MILLLVACYPVLGGPAPVPLPAGQRAEVTFSAGGGYVPTSRNQNLKEMAIAGAGGLSFRMETQDGWGVVVRADAGVPHGISGGAGLRYGFIRRHDVYFGMQADVGLLYGGMSVPFALRVKPRWWVWTRPGVNVGFVNLGMLPIGSTFEFGKRFALQAEVTLLTPVLDSRFARRQPAALTGALSLATRF